MTTTKHNIIVIATAIVVAAAIPVFLKKKQPIIIYKTFHTAAGWGYDVMKNNRIFIHQEYIPSIEMKQGFSQECEAEKVAEYITQKIKNNKPPTVSQTELEQLCAVNRK